MAAHVEVSLAAVHTNSELHLKQQKQLHHSKPPTGVHQSTLGLLSTNRIAFQEELPKSPSSSLSDTGSLHNHQITQDLGERKRDQFTDISIDETIATIKTSTRGKAREVVATHKPLVISTSTPISKSSLYYERSGSANNLSVSPKAAKHKKCSVPVVSSPDNSSLKECIVSSNCRSSVNSYHIKTSVVDGSGGDTSASNRQTAVLTARSVSNLNHKLGFPKSGRGGRQFPSSPDSSPHKPLIAQHSSPSLNRISSRTPVSTPPRSPRSPLFLSSINAPSRKSSFPKVTRTSPTLFQFPYQYSKVPKSDSAYSEEPYSYSPLPRGNSPWSDFQNSYSHIPNYDGNYTYSSGIPKSDSAFIEQTSRSSIKSGSYLPKSHSTILRSDSAYSEIEYSYSTIPQSDSCFLEKEYSYSSLPKSDSVYSENIICSDDAQHTSIIPRSISTYSHKLVKFSEPDLKVVSPSIAEKDVLNYIATVAYLPEEGLHCDTAKLQQKPLIESSSILSCQTSSTNITMPTLKSLLKPHSRHSNVNNPFKINKHSSNKHLTRDTSVPTLRLISTQDKNNVHMKKSHTVLALSSNASSSNLASTKLLTNEPATIRTSCSINNCLSKKMKHSISQTLNQSIGQNLNLLSGSRDQGRAPQKRQRKSTLSSLLPRSFSRTSSLAPSLTSARGSYLGSFVGSCGDTESDTLYCRLCLMEVSVNLVCQLTVCQCRFCKYVSTISAVHYMYFSQPSHMINIF